MCRLSPYVIQTILGAVSVVGTVPALYLIETWGRRNVWFLISLLSSLPNSKFSLVPSYRFYPRSHLLPHCRPCWALHARTSRNTSRTTYSTKPSRRRYAYRVRRFARFLLLNVLGTYSLGLPWRKFPSPCPTESNCFG